ncbi:MAG TPA: hypothetical protein QKA08_03300, partial [Candidatus Megaira endosymbiont of Nemacystus decipiens]|nr:hypothetical protein [Candidatus Megaera endosymbiont of Nemacystus decipiens]
MNFNIDMAIVSAFLLLTLFVGLGYGQKVRSIKDYALGDRKFSTGALVATIVATWVSGGSFAFYMAETYTHGLYFIIAIIADALSFLIIAHFFVPKMQSFLGKLSVAEMMGDLYGKEIRIVTAITGFIGTIGALAIQFKIFSNILGYFFYIPTVYSTTISAMIVVAYSTFGGVRSVTFTDAIQIITFSIVIPIIGFIIWQDIGEPQLIANLINTNANFDISKLLDYTQVEFLGTLAIFVYFLVPGFSPATFQRISMSANIVQSKKSFILAGFYLLIIELLIAWIAILVLVKDPSLEPYNILNYIIDNYTYYGFKGVIIISIMAMIMSTADSYISSAAVLFSHDFCRPLKLIKQHQELLISRIFCIVVGSISIIMSLKVDSIFNLFILGYGPYMTVVTVPFMLSVLNFNISKGSVICGMLFGILGSLVWKYFSVIEVDDTVLGMLFNLIAIFLREQVFYRKKLHHKNSIIKTISIIDFLKKFCQKTILTLKKVLIKAKPKEEHYYPLVAMCFFVSIFSIVYSTPYDIRLAHKNLIDGIYQSTLVFATMFLTYPIWPEKIKLKKYINILWILGLFYNMVFVPSLLIILSDFDQINLMIFLINLLILTNLLDWRLSLISIMTGVFFSFKIYEYLYLPIVWNTQLKLVYMLTLVIGILFAFLKPKQEYQEDTEAKVDTLEGELEGLDDIILNLKKQEGEYTKQIADLNQAVTHYSERVT